jgi:hypothetical protein
MSTFARICARFSGGQAMQVRMFAMRQRPCAPRGWCCCAQCKNRGEVWEELMRRPSVYVAIMRFSYLLI